MVTSYARIFMNKIKLEILNNGGLIYYTDTDSIVIDKNSLIYLKNLIVLIIFFFQYINLYYQNKFF